MKIRIKHIHLILPIIFAITLQTSAQKKLSDAAIFEPLMPELRLKTRVPLKLPTYLGNEQTEEWPLYAIIEEATPTRYFLQIAFSPDCSGGTACRWGGATGERIGSQTERPTGKPIKLANGITGYFVDSTCGANCSDSVLTWDQGGHRYTVESKAGSPEFLKKVANSAIAYTASRTMVSMPAGLDKELFSSVDDFLKKAAGKKGDEVVSAKGDLNGDGIEDSVVNVHRPAADYHSDQLYILVRQGATGPFRIEVTNGEWQTAHNGCCWVEQIEIKNSSLYIQYNAKTHGTMEATTHQFKQYKGAWRLVGVRVFYLDIGRDTSITTDSNVLTGGVVITEEKGDRPTGVTTRRKKFRVSYLKDYDYNSAFGIK
jgi:hypothetical protein